MVLICRKVPACGGIAEIVRVFVLPEGELRSDTEDAALGGHKKRLNVTTVLGVVDLRELRPNKAVFDFLRETFEDDGLISFFRANDNVSVRGNIFCFASARASAEPEGTLPPDAPNQHEVR